MASTEDQRKAFSARLATLMNAQRMTDAELARKANQKGKKYNTDVNRDHIYRYKNAQTIPGPARLKAVCDALGVDADALLPVGPPKAVRDSTPTAEFISPTRVRLRIDQEMPFDVASKVLGILEGLKK